MAAASFRVLVSSILFGFARMSLTPGLGVSSTKLRYAYRAASRVLSITSRPTSSARNGSNSRPMLGQPELAIGALRVSKNLRNIDSISRFGLVLQNGAKYWRKFLNVISSVTSLESIEDMFRTMFRALSAFSGLGSMEMFRSLPFGLKPELLIERRSTNTLSGVSPQEPAFVM